MDKGASPSATGPAPFGLSRQEASQAKPLVPSAGVPWDAEVAFILGRPGFMFIREAQLFRSLGYDIPKRAEDEQAFFIHRWLNLYFRHGDAWRDVANADIREHIHRAKGMSAGTAETAQQAQGEARQPGAEGIRP
jgi:hypothetical protein